MTTTDWIIDITLILIVLRQVKEGRLDLMFLAVPLVLVSWTAVHYLRDIPTAGHDLALVAVLAGAGALLGLASGAATRVRFDGGHAYVRAGALAATLWVLGTGTRLAFQLYATHGGGEAVARFSLHHQITGSNAWASALVLMALSEVVVRLGLIVVRARVGLSRAAREAASASAPLHADTQALPAAQGVAA